MQKIDEKNTFKCPDCNSMWLYGLDDIVDGHVTCPYCGTTEKVFQTKYPNGFFHFSVDSGAKQMSDDWINQAIDTCMHELEQDPELQFDFMACGTCMVIVLRMEDGFYTVVTNDYYENED